jgi:transposase InsO family protein
VALPGHICQHRQVARALDQRGIKRAVPAKMRRKSAPRPRRFERIQPRELWQTDITSYVITQTKTRVYLVVFLDDRSRYVVSFGLFVRMRAEAVCEVLLEGVARYGKPKEVLSDQGPQYFTWRGKSAFQKLLLREGIRHVVARSHHPQTVEKCERLWETVAREFWERANPLDLADTRVRLEHFFAHYNFFRPHQGIDGVVPANRFFGAEDALRKTIEARLARDELDVALAQPPRQSVYLFGQIGDEQVSLHGERGGLVVATSSGVRTQMGLLDLGASTGLEEKRKDGRDGWDDDRARVRSEELEEEARGAGEEDRRPGRADPALDQPAQIEERDGTGDGGAGEPPRKAPMWERQR